MDIDSDRLNKEYKMSGNSITGIALCFLIVAEVSGCTNVNSKVSDAATERRAIETTIRNAIGWAKNKDLTLLYGSIANDTTFLEIHPGNTVVKGIEEFKKNEAFWMSPDFKAIRYEIRDLTISISGSGDVAWWFCILDDINEWKGQPAYWENTRWTGVLEKYAGKWVIVQQHFSFASE
jgi:ketosteroid isomerase-like protein